MKRLTIFMSALFASMLVASPATADEDSILIERNGDAVFILTDANEALVLRSAVTISAAEGEDHGTSVRYIYSIGDEVIERGTVNVTGDIKVVANGGDDRIVVNGVDVPRTLDVNLGNAAPEIEPDPGSVGLVVPPDEEPVVGDRLVVVGGSVGEDLRAVGVKGAQRIRVDGGFEAGDGIGVRTNDGDDTLVVRDVQVEGDLNATMGSGDDVVRVGNASAPNGDALIANGVTTLLGRVLVYTSSGDDRTTIRHTQTEDITVQAGTDEDRVVVNANRVFGRLIVNAGARDDVVRVAGNGVGGLDKSKPVQLLGSSGAADRLVLGPNRFDDPVKITGFEIIVDSTVLR